MRQVQDIFFRVDASEDIGMGHLMRSLALAQGAKRHGYSVTFITRPYLKQTIQQIKENGFKVFKIPVSSRWNWRQDAEKTVEIMNNPSVKNKKWLAIDNYFFGSRYQKFVKATGNYLISIDDIAKGKFFSDIVVNHGIHAEDFHYHLGLDVRCLLGPRYALLRKDILKGEDHKNQSRDNVKNILITMGGVYKQKNLQKIYRALSELMKRGINVKVAAGVKDMSRLYLWADLVISTASTSVLEACYYGLTGVVCVVANNQDKIAKKLNDNNIFLSVGWLDKSKTSAIANRVGELIDNKILRMEMSKKARNLVDGKGVDRIIRHMKAIENGKS